MSELLCSQLLYFPIPSIAHSNKLFIHYKLKAYTDIHQHVHVDPICVYYPDYVYKDKSCDEMICSCFNEVDAFPTTCPFANLNVSKMPIVSLLRGWLPHSTVNNAHQTDLEGFTENAISSLDPPSRLTRTYSSLIATSVTTRSLTVEQFLELIQRFLKIKHGFGGGEDLRESTVCNNHSWVHLVISVIMKFPHGGLRGWLISLVFSTARWVPHGQHWCLDWIHNNRAIPNGWV